MVPCGLFAGIIGTITHCIAAIANYAKRRGLVRYRGRGHGSIRHPVTISNEHVSYSSMQGDENQIYLVISNFAYNSSWIYTVGKGECLTFGGKLELIENSD